jgi:hypothetical protein
MEACDLHRTHVSLLERGRINVTVNTARQIPLENEHAEAWGCADEAKGAVGTARFARG